MTIRAKLTLSIVLFFGSGLAFIGSALTGLEFRQIKARNREDSAIIEKTVRRAARDALAQKDDILLISYIKFLREQFPALIYCRATLIDGASSRSNRIGPAVVADRVEETKVLEADPGQPGRRVEIVVGISQDILDARVERELNRIKRDLLRLFAIALLGAAVFSDWFARRLTRPLGALSEGVAQIGRGRLGIRLEWDSADEVGALVQGFNSMSERLEELDSMKKDFVSSVTHELRSPLGAIESFLNLLEGKIPKSHTSSSAQIQDYLARIQANVRRLSGFISDLLDVAKLEKGKMECALRPMSIQEVAEEVVRFFEPKAKEQGVSLTNRIARETGPVQGDPERLRQVLVNLVSNALKFTPKGGKVWLQAEQYREDGAKFCEVSVCDSGRGMDAADRERLFQKFSQGKNVDAGVSGPRGTGLGLYIVKSIVESHGGKVGVKSTSGGGAQFYFSVKMV